MLYVFVTHGQSPPPKIIINTKVTSIMMTKRKMIKKIPTETALTISHLIHTHYKTTFSSKSLTLQTKKHIQNWNLFQPSHRICKSNISFYPPGIPTEEYLIINLAPCNTFTRYKTPSVYTYWKHGSTMAPQDSHSGTWVSWFSLACSRLIEVDLG